MLVTAEEWGIIVDKIGTSTKTGDLIGVTYRTVLRYRKGETSAPRIVVKNLLPAIEGVDGLKLIARRIRGRLAE